MVAYTGAKGGKVQNFSSDPTNPYVGQVWYNSTSSVLKVASSSPTGAWATGGSMNTARADLAGAGIQTAALAFGGGTPSPTVATESYNGTSWTAVNNLNTGRFGVGGTGTNTAALAFGGFTTVNVVNTETWNGTSWTVVNTLSVPRANLSAAGTNAVAVAFGGGPPAQTSTEEWNSPYSVTNTITTTT